MGQSEAGSAPPGIDATVAHQARIYDYWLGGKDNFAADREAAEQALAAYPAIRVGVRAQRAFLTRVVHYLAAKAGIGQFRDIGTGIPTASNTPEVAQAVAPAARIVYVDIHPEQIADAARRMNARSAGTTTLRTHTEVARFFDGLESLEPGLVQVHRWQPGSAAPEGGQQIASYAGLARKH